MKPLVFGGWFTVNQGRVVTPLLLTPSRFHAMIFIVSGNVDGHIEGVETGETVQTQQQVTRLSFALMTFPTGNRGFHKVIGGKLNCFTRMDGPGKCGKHEPEPDQHSRKATAMATENTTTPTYYCPNCGQPLDTEIQRFDLVTPNGEIHNVTTLCTCRDNNCAAYGITLSPDLMQTKDLSRYERKPVRRFDVFSGDPIALAEVA